MKVKFFVTFAFVAILAVGFAMWDSNPHTTTAVQAAEPVQPTRQGAWLDSIVFSEQNDANQAVVQLQANELDVYAYTVSDPALYQTVLEDPNLTQTEVLWNLLRINLQPIWTGIR